MAPVAEEGTAPEGEEPPPPPPTSKSKKKKKATPPRPPQGLRQLRRIRRHRPRQPHPQALQPVQDHVLLQRAVPEAPLKVGDTEALCSKGGLGAWRRWKQPKQRQRKLAKGGRRRQKKEVAAMEKERSAPSAWSASTIPSSALHRGLTARTASTGRAWMSRGVGACSRRVRCAARSCRQRGHVRRRMHDRAPDPEARAAGRWIVGSAESSGAAADGRGGAAVGGGGEAGTHSGSVLSGCHVRPRLWRGCELTRRRSSGTRRRRSREHAEAQFNWVSCTRRARAWM